MDDFVGRSWSELHKVPGFGRGKIDRLLSIFAAAVTAAPKGNEQVDAGPPPAIPWLHVLQQLGIPEAFPITLMPLPTRLREFCLEGEVTTLGGLLELYERQGGETALLKVRNLGRSTTSVARRLYDAACIGEEEVLGEFLPLRYGGGLGLTEGMFLLLRGIGEVQRTVLRARMIEGRTLGIIGFEMGLSTERVRQLEHDLIESTAALLDWFAAERDACYARIGAQESFAEMFASLSDEDGRLSQRLIQCVFDESPSGAAHAEKLEALRYRWLEELQATPDFYLGNVVIQDWASSRGGGAQIMASFIAQSVRAGEFTHDERTGCVRAARRPIKQVAAAYLRGWSDVEAEDWLRYLNRVGFLHEMTLENLRRNHQTWREDPEFPVTEVRYPASAGRIRALLSEGRTAGRPVTSLSAFTRQHAAPPELPELDACNSLVIGALAAADGVGIIGLLPLAVSDQQRIAKAVRQAHGGGVSMLLRLLRYYPAAVCYAAALAAGEGMVAGAFWPPVAAALGLDLPPPRHPEFSERFRVASIALGLLPPDARPGNLVWPFIFQAGVVPQFVPHLVNAIKRYLTQQPPPDFEDAGERRAFADAILPRVPVGSTRLRDTLASPAGPCVCAAILRAHRENDFGQLPPHLEGPMRQAFEGTDSKLHFAAPRLEFSRTEGEVVLHLPRQPHRLVLPTSHWTVGKERTYAADEPASVPVASLDAVNVLVGLRLRPPFEPWSRTLALRPAPGGPPHVFRLPGGRSVDLRPDPDDTIRLSAGEYAVVVPGTASSNVQGGWTALETGCRWIEYAAFPNQIPLEINTEAGKSWKIVPRVEAAITVLTDRGGNRLATGEGEWIYYGDDLFVSVFVPSELAAAGEAFDFVCADAAGTMDRRLTFDGAAFADGSGGEIDAAWTRATLAALPAGIHVLRLELLSPRVSVRQQVVFWQGLRYPKEGWGFACAVPLDNVALDNSAGVRVEADGLAVSAGPHAAEVRLALAQPPIVLSLARPGVTLKLIDAATGEVRWPDGGGTLGCDADDPTRVVVECNDQGRWTLLANGELVREFPEGTGQFARSVAGFFQGFGDVAALAMRSPGGTTLPLLTLTRLAMAEGFDCELRPGANCYQGGFRLPGVFAELGVSLESVLAGDDAHAPVVAMGFAPGHHDLEWAGVGVIAFEVNTALSGEHIVLFRLERATLARGVYLARFFCRQEGEEAWSPLHVPDPGGSVEARLCFVSHPFAPQADAPLLDGLLTDAWAGAMASGASASPAGAGIGDEAALAACFRRIGTALNYPYPTAGWHSVKWMRRAFTALCRQGVRVYPGPVAALAVEEISVRSRHREALYRPLAFGLPKLWTLDGSLLSAEGLPGDLIGRSFAAWAALGSGCALPEFFGTPAGQAVDFGFVMSYLLGRDRHERFLRELGEKVFELDGSHGPASAVSLLSVEHFCHALGRLDRVTRAVTQVGRHAMVSDLLRLDGRLTRLAAFVKGHLRISNAVALDLDLYAASPAPEVRRLLLALTALARLQAAGRVSKAEARQQLDTLFESTPADPTPIHKGLSLLVGLGGDFFACCLLFWELSLRASP